MDVVTHAIIGAIIAELALWELDREQRIQGRWVGAAAAAAPDLGNVPAHFVFSWSNGDWPWVYDPSHWEGVHGSYWLLGYWFTHSLLIAFIAWVFARHKGWRTWPIMAWASHGTMDVLSHTGAWSTWPLFPLPGQIEWVGDPWSWSPFWWGICISFALCAWYATSVMTSRWRANTLEP